MIEKMSVVENQKRQADDQKIFVRYSLVSIYPSPEAKKTNIIRQGFKQLKVKNECQIIGTGKIASKCCQLTPKCFSPDIQ